MNLRLSRYLSSGLLVVAAGVGLVTLVDCSSPRGCANDTDCFEGQSCSPDGVCVALDTPPDADMVDASREDVSVEQDTQPRADTSDSGPADIEPTKDDASDGGTNPRDVDGIGDADTRDTGPDEYACEDPPGDRCAIEDQYESDDQLGVCITRDDLDNLADPDDADECQRNVECGADFDGFTGRTIQAALCRDDPEEGQDEFKFMARKRCESLTRTITATVAVEKACAPDMYRVKGGYACRENEIVCRFSNNNNTLEMTIPAGSGDRRDARKVNFYVVPDCGEDCQFETEYTLTVDIEGS